MKYILYPGCCLQSSGKPCGESILSVFKSLDYPLEELKDWSCCGATAYMSVDELKSFVLSARNMAVAIAQNPAEKGGLHIVAPCSACYSLMLKTQHYIEEKPDIGTVVKGALKEIGLPPEGLHNGVTIRHPLDVLVNDIGLERIKEKVKKPLQGLKVACYYGCLLVRPYGTFDSVHNPTTMDRLAAALGAEPVDWPLKTRCCGATLSGTIPGVGLRLSYLILKEAQKRGAEMVLTACPVCQMDLECFQDQMTAKFTTPIHIPVLYFTQLAGMAFGTPDKEIGLKRLFIQPKLPSAAQGG